MFFSTTKSSILKLLSSSSSSSTSSLFNNNTIIRSKHSNRQIKKLFQQNPAFKRVSSRNQTIPKKITSPPPSITIEPFYKPNLILPNGWSQPPPSPSLESSSFSTTIEEKRNQLPFGIKRTTNKPNNAIGFLPIYSNFKLGGSKQTTIIKKVYGNKKFFVNELKAILGISIDDHDCITLRGSGNVIEVKGNRVREVKSWLAGLGF